MQLEEYNLPPTGSLEKYNYRESIPGPVLSAILLLSLFIICDVFIKIDCSSDSRPCFPDSVLRVDLCFF